ncbi:hypothetical protein D3C72_2217250 [compost metagenome]
MLWALPRVSCIETATPSAVPLVIAIDRLVTSGSASRTACGRMMKASVRQGLKASAVAASHCPFGTATIDAQNISAAKADSTAERPKTVARKGDSVMPR